MTDPLPLADSAAPPLSVTRLNRLVRECLEARFPLLWVSGEISNLTVAASGHVYFSLKDGTAQVRCVMWRQRAQMLGRRLTNGQQIDVRALVSVYEPRGEFQLSVETVRHAGQGALFEHFLRLKTQLENEGLFAVDRKRPLPAFPRRLALVTSLQAAALRDVLTALTRRAPYLRLTLLPVPVQGEGAGERIASVLGTITPAIADATLLCRGGGSIEDLWAFNEEIVARAIRACAVPVVTGIGHETDFTIADFAADLRAPTPTAAAELIAPDIGTLNDRLAVLQRRLRGAQRQPLQRAAQTLDRLALRLVHPAERLSRQRERLDAQSYRLAQAAHRPLEKHRRQLDIAASRLAASRPDPATAATRLDHQVFRLHTAGQQLLDRKKTKLSALAGSLTQLDPGAVLRRGYAIVLGPDGRTVRDARQLAPGDKLQLTFCLGSAQATVTHAAPASLPPEGTPDTGPNNPLNPEPDQP